MGKKKAINASGSHEKTRFELRFDEQIYNRMKKLADDAQISVNQLMQGITNWAVTKAQLGEVYRDESGRICNRKQAGMVWFGRPAEYYSVRYERTGPDDDDVEEVPGGWNEGELLFSLDFTERRILSDEI